VKARGCQTEDIEIPKPPPSTPPGIAEQMDEEEDEERHTPAITALNNTLSNLKWGFKRR
jgi:hypothetical protein